MCTKMPQEFVKSTEVLPFTKYGVSTLEDFEKAEKQIQDLEWLKRAGLTNEEVKLYQENEAGLLKNQTKVESRVLNNQLVSVYCKIKKYQQTEREQNEEPCTSSSNTIQSTQVKSSTFYPEGHPIHELKEIEASLFGHLKNEEILSLTKRRKILRRLERRKERIISQQKQVPISSIAHSSNTNSGSLWDVKDLTTRVVQTKPQIIGPKPRTLYTIKDNKIVRLEQKAQDEFQAVDIVLPQNKAEERLLEGTKMSLDDIKKIERFKDYEPGAPSKVLYLKNIAPSVTEDKLAMLFNQFQLENGCPIDVKLLSGRMRGQAFVTFQSENLAIQALDEVNGTIMSGRPIIVQFGRNSNRVENEDNR
ncbi:RNA-binding protein 41-like [Zerene cesonia]|uniref:RNA-binding protein 41-like n=1 Tax=Zerene cesonia TaxID=33412 RepID=UPI0018E4FEFA|nr:RNA-binding protein 41-like [Zerene cesonia]